MIDSGRNGNVFLAKFERRFPFSITRSRTISLDRIRDEFLKIFRMRIVIPDCQTS